MLTLVEIAKTWLRYQQASPITRNRIDKRLRICDKCTNKKQINGTTGVVKNGINDPNNIFRCSLCNCTLISLSSSLYPACKANKWPE